MHSSRPIQVRGRFIGVAIAQPVAAAATASGLWRFLATDPAAEDIDGTNVPNPAEAERVAALVIARNGGGAAPGTTP